MQQSLKLTNPENIPVNRKGRIKDLRALTPKQKTNFVPGIGVKLRLGPYIFRVCSRSTRQLKFSAELHDVIIEGVNDEMPVIEPT